MDDFISRQQAIDTAVTFARRILLDSKPIDVKMSSDYIFVNLVEPMRKLPSVQSEIIRCKDCRWKYGAECVRFAEIRPFPDDFCSRAERRTDE